MALTPDERAQVADVLYSIDESERHALDEEWVNVARHRADELDKDTVRALTRDQMDEYLDARARERSRGPTSRSILMP